MKKPVLLLTTFLTHSLFAQSFNEADNSVHSSSMLMTQQENAAAVQKEISSPTTSEEQFKAAIVALQSAKNENEMKEATGLLTQSASKGFVQAQFILSNILLSSHDAAAQKEGMNWLIKASNQKYPMAQTLLGQIYLSQPNKAKIGFALLQAAARQESPEAIFILGLAHLQGVKDVVAVSQIKAKEYLLKAAQKDFAPAQTLLGFMMTQNPNEVKTGITYLEKAAKQEWPEAQFILGKLLCEGSLKGLPANVARGVALLQGAADQDMVPAMVMLAQIYEKGLKGQKADPQKAKAYLERAAALSKAA